MARIHELLEQVKDPALRKRLIDEVENLMRNKKFGLVFEDHDVERTPLYGMNIRSGMPVAKKSGKIDEVWDVLRVEDGHAFCRRVTTGETETFATEDLVAVAQFGDPIFPMLQPIDRIENAPDSTLWHTLIEADNYHALQLLEYLYAGKVDCIYIDPPYNTGARDWKYNNDYVDGTDSYRHSKWLSMMEKRLKIAKRLLNPDDSVLIVTIDEKEYLHLGCLLEELFSEAHIQMICSVINRAGSVRQNEFSRCAEYIFFVMIGNASPCEYYYDMTGIGNESESKSPVLWQYLKRRGSTNGDLRKGRPGLFYPIFIDKKTETIHSIGESIPADMDIDDVVPPVGCWAAWPLRDDGNEGIWQVQPDRLRIQLKEGTCFLSKVDEQKRTAHLLYLKSGDRRKVLNGDITILGKDENGKLQFADDYRKKVRAKDVWVMNSHNSNQYGSQLLNSIIGKRFTFPKSLYAVQDTIRFFVASKPNAVILDFFAGSGTTLHAVNLLNTEDGGHRRCILVTNNEVSADEAKALSRHGYHPGDAEWERYGIARYVTWPRTVCSIEGHDINGEPLKGDYIDSDRPMSEGFPANVEYFKLGFLDRNRVSLGMQFREILPLLWLKTGAVGRRPELQEGEELPEMMVLPENGFAVLLEEECFSLFAKELKTTEGIRTVYFVTDSEEAFREMTNNIGIDDTYQLYREYIDNFVIGRR